MVEQIERGKFFEAWSWWGQVSTWKPWSRSQILPNTWKLPGSSSPCKGHDSSSPRLEAAHLTSRHAPPTFQPTQNHQITSRTYVIFFPKCVNTQHFLLLQSASATTIHWTCSLNMVGAMLWHFKSLKLANNPCNGEDSGMDLIYILQICCLLLQPEKHANLRVRSPWLRLWSSMLHLFAQASDLGMILLGAMQFNMLKQSKEHGQPLQPATCCFSHCKFPQLWPPGLHSAVRKSRIYNKISSIQIPLSPSFGMFSIHLDSFDAKRALWMLWLHESKNTRTFHGVPRNSMSTNSIQVDFHKLPSARLLPAWAQSSCFWEGTALADWVQA